MRVQSGGVYPGPRLGALIWGVFSRPLNMVPKSL